MLKQRKAPRYKFGITCTLHSSSGGAGTNAVIHGISTLGCQLRHGGALKIGEKCELYFEWKGNYFGLVARVVWKDALGRMGLVFLGLEKGTRGQLEELCTALGAQPEISRAPEERPAPTLAPAHPRIHPPAQHAAPAAIPFSAPPPRPPERKRRQMPRYACALPGHLLNPATGSTAGVQVLDISVSGALVGGPDLPELGQSCELQTEWEGRQLSVLGDVTWKAKGQVGIRFSSLDPENQRLLKRICANSRLLPLAPFPE